MCVPPAGANGRLGCVSARTERPEKAAACHTIYLIYY